jgi:hypothetical protein
MTLPPSPDSIDRVPLVLGVVALSLLGVALLPKILNEENDFIILAAADDGRSIVALDSFSLIASIVGASGALVGDSTFALLNPEKLENFRSSDDPVEGLVDAVPGLSDDDVEGRSRSTV